MEVINIDLLLMSPSHRSILLITMALLEFNDLGLQPIACPAGNRDVWYCCNCGHSDVNVKCT